MFKCEICYDWCSRLEITEQWWNIAKKDWNLLNGKDLPYYIAILAVLREIAYEIFDDKETSKNHSELKKDKQGYAIAANKNCEFIPLSESKKQNKWHGLYLTIRAFRNGSAHIKKVQTMNPILLNQIRNPEDSTQNYYRYALYPDLKPFDESELNKIHEFIKPTILSDVRTSNSVLPSIRIKYEFISVERGLLLDLLHTKMKELLTEVRVL